LLNPSRGEHSILEEDINNFTFLLKKYVYYLPKTILVSYLLQFHRLYIYVEPALA
jgi:hypothetical protein